MTLPKVAVLLAGYNGHKYIHEQVLTLLNQESVSVEIFIRVDGDSKIFENIVVNLTNSYENIHFIKGDVISSPSSNFYELIFEVNGFEFDYYAFCDQDDVWDSDKLKKSISFFNDGTVHGYSSGFTTFNASGKKKKYSVGSQTRFDYLFQSSGPGCTFVLSRHGFNFLKNYLKLNKELLSVLAHDWLIYFVFRLNGISWVIDNDSHILYRQHASNVAGANDGILAKAHRFKLLFKGWYFSDLKRLFLFLEGRGFRPKFSDVFNLRRSKLQSLFIWTYFWIYFRFNIN